MSTFQKKKSSFWVSPKCAGVLKRRLFLGIPICQKLSQAVSVIWAPRPSHDFRLGLLAVSKIFVRIFLKSLVFPHFPCSNPQPRWFPTLAKSSPLECFASPGLTLPNSVSTSENSGLSGMDLCIWASRSSKHPETLRWFHTQHQVILKSSQTSLSSLSMLPEILTCCPCLFLAPSPRSFSLKVLWMKARDSKCTTLASTGHGPIEKRRWQEALTWKIYENLLNVHCSKFESIKFHVDMVFFVGLNEVSAVLSFDNVEWHSGASESCSYVHGATLKLNAECHGNLNMCRLQNVQNSWTSLTSFADLQST